MDARDSIESQPMTETNPDAQASPQAGAGAPARRSRRPRARRGAEEQPRRRHASSCRASTPTTAPTTPCAASTSASTPTEVTAIIGPSGCGKSTMVRCVNRMHEEIAGARAEGQVLLDGLDLYDSRIDVVAVRRAVGMVFQKPNPFPTMSIFDNVASGLAPDRRLARRDRRSRPRGAASAPASGTRSRTASRAPGWGSPAASSSASASPGRWRSSPRCC